MQYYERSGNIHIHTTFSDGTGTFSEIAHAAQEAGLDFVIVTDHNAYHPQGAGWYGRTLVLVGQEIHCPARPDENHLLALGVGRDLASEADDLKRLVATVHESGGLAYMAHPIEHSGAYAQEPEINWVDREGIPIHGLEIWNYMSEFKGHIHSVAHALLYAFLPDLAIRGPWPETLRLWDQLLAERMVYAIGGSDAHARTYSLGFLKRTLWSYSHLFQAVNTHLLLAGEWSGRFPKDEGLIYEALRHGRGFVAYDHIAPARTTRLVVETNMREGTFGETFPFEGNAWLRAWVPAKAHLRLVRDGEIVAEAVGQSLEYKVEQGGVYRLEAWKHYWGRLRGWIFGNPVRLLAS